MELLGIKFAPLFVPLERRLQTLAALMWIVILPFGGLMSWLLLVYLVLYTRLRYIALAYAAWCAYDWEVCRRGGRRLQWARRWLWWRYFRDFFPLRLERIEPLDPNRNYLFCAFPHGVLSAGVFGCFSTDYMGWDKLFPGITVYPLTLEQHFKVPFFRELCLSLGGCSASAESIGYLMDKPGGGNAAVLIVGGASEALKCKPRTYRVILKRRRGFIRLALKHGCPLVPVISFGETDLYDQLEGTRLLKFQHFCRKITGMAPVLPIGRGLFQYSFGIVPRRNPVTTVVGSPIEVKKVEDPTQEQITELHNKFSEELVNFFEKYKHKYISDADNVHLEIEE
ncbi:2-acylglycerol O-acyltransferase 2-like [Schistocerca americana]|uniref:2-acylglycerol O-acyltransferase 2-like n=1 Tax=Schistocerca americana TaxID=7009 RepID=UPI001F4FF80A|nr:2-acylglycerol O-acyltransferase 2-like [Schistocerca americana]XP_046997081.1 2-acylglycerol O-acyltransferase 2-like [Schistocerca americana]XP_047115123.1 2-acylglycerol O-acyltransferase 2-like [Schistocerca piceifrons]XP_047115124.1 2-acylglycerol O-acyltransferase 2-like [Schistocerca piceifrons]XP_049961241.1 2-acylglycerol O-acyltransferase 2-like [Schistocerca serialis cubense]XP_049961242.1 2-acylglycerol O-acyltransferase 2-like [Schistocerca serialis cubense]